MLSGQNIDRTLYVSDLDTHIWEHACKTLAKWKTLYPELFISINISPKNFYFTDVIAVITGLVKKYDICKAYAGRRI